MISAAFSQAEEEPFIYLLVLVQRNFVNLHGNCRYHIGRLCLFNKIIQGIDINSAVRYHIGSNIFSTIWIIKGNYSGILMPSYLRITSSTSESSILKPLILTWESFLPMIWIFPSGRNLATSPE